MKILTIIAIFIFCPYFIMAQENNKSIYSDHVPSWVKKKVTVEEYNMLETINTIFNIDYSFLQQKLTPKQKKRLHQRIQEMYADIQNGKYTNKEKINLTFAPLGNYGDLDYKGELVPDSIKKIVNEKEYEALQTIAGFYKLDYSFANEITNLSPEEREKFLINLQKIVQSTKKEEFRDRKGSNLTLLIPAQVDENLKWEYDILYQIDSNLQFCKRKAIVHTSQHNNKAKVYLEVWYVYDSAKKKANILSHKMSSSMPLSEFHGSAALSHWEKENLLQGEFSGTYEYYDEYKQKHWEDVRKGFHIPLEQ